jgi:hypothetical protein
VKQQLQEGDHSFLQLMALLPPLLNGTCHLDNNVDGIVQSVSENKPTCTKASKD